MPFLGQDWRQPGEQWVKNMDGWHRLELWRLKMFGNLNDNVIARLIKQAECDNQLSNYTQMSDCHTAQPHIYMCTHQVEQKPTINIADAFGRLDLCGAAKDSRRFRFICKILEVMIQKKMCYISGSAQKQLFNVLEDVFNSVMKTQNNVHILKRLLAKLNDALKEGCYSHIGSSSLWQRHLDSLNRMQNCVNNIEFKERQEDGKLMLSDLPDDCLREIMCRFPEYRDVINTAEVNDVTKDIATEKWVWKDLCLFHFSNDQILQIIKHEKRLKNLDAEGWKDLHIRLVKRFGEKDAFVEVISLCRNCSALFWQYHGHPCLLPKAEPKVIMLSPDQCVEIFTGGIDKLCRLYKQS